MKQEGWMYTNNGEKRDDLRRVGHLMLKEEER
jgi:hypothetical protein